MTLNPLRILLIDDERSIRSICKNYLSALENVTIIGECGSIAEAKVLIKNTEPNLVLLDIQLEDGTSFELLKHFTGFTFKIVFITAFEKYALTAIKAGALDYVLKPIDEEELLAAVSKARISSTISSTQIETATAHIEGKPKRLIVRTLEAIHVINFDELMYCRSDKGYTTFYLVDNSEVLVSKPLKDYEHMLPDSIFIRTHQSYMVNVNFIYQLKKELVLILKNKQEIPVSFRKKEEIIQRLGGLRK